MDWVHPPAAPAAMSCNAFRVAAETQSSGASCCARCFCATDQQQGDQRGGLGVGPHPVLDDILHGKLGPRGGPRVRARNADTTWLRVSFAARAGDGARANSFTASAKSVSPAICR